MHERVLKAVTILSGILTLIVCVSVQFFPKMHEEYVQADEIWEWVMQEDLESEPDQEGVSSLGNALKQLPVEELVQHVVVEEEPEEESDEGQLNISMAESVDMDSLKIENDYLNQMAYISFKTNIKDFAEAFHISGSPDHIENLSYYNSKDRGIIALELDGVYELDYEILEDDNALSLDIVDPHDIYDKVVVLDAGHGGKQPGAVMLSTIEKDINLEILLETKKLLDQQDNIKVYCTRLSDVNPTLEQRANLANKSKANLFISIHNNSNMTGRFDNRVGTHLLYSQSDMGEYSSARLAAICVRNVSEILGSKNLGLMEADNIYIIRSSEVPVALIEFGYLTNREELEKLNTKEYRELAAQGVYNSIMEAFEDGF